MLDPRLLKEPWRLAAVGVAALTTLILATSQTLTPYDALREQTFDVMLNRLMPSPPQGTVIVVDIDRASLERSGPWPWGREQIAALVERIAAATPAAIGIDILIDGPDERSPAALARRLAELTGAESARALASAGLLDGDARLAAVLSRAPVVLGLVLDPDTPTQQPTGVPVLMQGGSDLSGIWQAGGVAGPPRELADVASGLGIIALAGDSDGAIRRVPLLAAAGSQLRPGLALETVRVGAKASAYVLARGNQLRFAQKLLPVGSDAALRLIPLDAAAPAHRTISAIDFDRPDLPAGLRERISGRIVLIGSSAPELAGLRLASRGALVPSVQLQATAVEQILATIHPRRPPSIDAIEVAMTLLAALAGLAAGLLWSPRRAILTLGAAALAWIAITGILLRKAQFLIDPLAVPVAGLAAVMLTAILVAAATRRREAALRQRFEQHLAPELVSRLVENPELLKLAGETREVTILFTDVEGFTAMTERSDPPTLIRVLDRYIDEISAIVVAHGGMVEKIVGDGFHALFNAPLDLPLHADKAVACARAIRAFSEDFAAESEPQSLGFGRTRIGIETGPVIVGDVGGGTRLDYTAYGNAMNTAARLEAANKDLGSAICIGPSTAGALTDASDLRPLGNLAVRGRTVPMAIHDIWPADMPQNERELWRDAVQQALSRPQEAIAKLQGIAKAHPKDPVIAGVIARIGDQAVVAADEHTSQ